jgi:hypothetical protein
MLCDNLARVVYPESRCEGSDIALGMPYGSQVFDRISRLIGRGDSTVSALALRLWWRLQLVVFNFFSRISCEAGWG